jgi:hypothetical protein
VWLFLIGFLIVSACSKNKEEMTMSDIIKITPRLQAVFEKTKTVCFGRYMVDVPASATVIWGETDVPLGVSVYPNGQEYVAAMAEKFINQLKDEKAIYKNDIPLLISVDNVNEPKGKIVTGFDGFEAINGLKINGYFELESAGVVVDSRPLRDEQGETIAMIKNTIHNLRYREENEIPVEPGNCLKSAFLSNLPDLKDDDRGEIIRIGFRLKEFPDTHLSIFTGPSNPHYSESNSLKWQLEKVEKNLAAEDSNHPNLKTKYLRRGTRQIHEWHDGFEALSRTPELPDVHSFHEFAMDFKGTPFDLLKPYADIRMQAGVADNAAGATKAGLTDEEAIALWDKITSTIRVRPTNAVSVKGGFADTVQHRPLGELAATGRECPQTGWWESDEPASIDSERRRYMRAGDRMPHILAAVERSVWQKLKGERPSHRIATVWKLVSYDDPSTTHANIALQVLSVEESSARHAVEKDVSQSMAKPDQHETTSPKKEV